MADELLGAVFDWSDFWAQRIAAEVLGLPSENDYDGEELLREFERRERSSSEGKAVNWKRDGF